jgi:hypothetical protein
MSNGWCWTPPITSEKYFAVKFNITDTPYFLTYPLVIDKIRFYMWPWRGQIFAMPVKLVVYDSDGITPLWNSSILQPISTTSGEWVEVNCSLVVYRDFYIALVYSDGVSGVFSFLGADTASPNGHSYEGPPMQPSTVSHNWMIRAVVSEAPVGGRLLDDTFAVVFLPTTIFLVPIVALSAYLLLNRRKIRI